MPNTEPAPNADLTRTELQVSGMTCQNCVRHVREALERVPGVVSAAVSLPNERASVRWQASEPVNVDALLRSAEEAGYPARIVDTPASAAPHRHSKAWQLNLWVGVAGMLLLMLGEWGFRLQDAQWFRWTAFGIATIVQIFAGAQFYRGAWNQLKVGSSNMDTLVALGSTTAYLYSAFVLFSGSSAHLYFMEAAAIISLISVGHWLEARVSARASKSLEGLLNLVPKTARRIPHNRRGRGHETLISFAPLRSESRDLDSYNVEAQEEVSVEELRIDDLVLIRPGDHVPTDAIVLDGNSALNESMLTGESMPADKAPGAKVYAGTVNLTGQLIARVSATGEGTALASIIAAVERAQTSRANIQRLGDRVSSVFVPIVVIIALATALFWGLAPEQARHLHDLMAKFLWQAHPPEGRWAAAFIIPAAVLIVACPCAMGLATPAAIMAASNAASRRGILIRDGVALEKAGFVTAVLFDKTGTLTIGAPQVAASHVVPGAPAGIDPLALAATLASRSTHPLSQAIARHRTFQPVPINNLKEIRGAGVEAALRHSPKTQLSITNYQLPIANPLPGKFSPLSPLGERATTQREEANGTEQSVARLGSIRWLRETGVVISEDHPFIKKWTDEGATILGLALNNSLICFFALKDAIKANARKVVKELQSQGLQIYLITGDNPRTAQSIGRQAGIPSENVLAEVRPEEKAAVVKRLQEQGQHVAFIGDGINDAPALEQADLGVAVTRASDVAREAADILLLNSEIEAVPQSLALARATLRTIRQNLFWAFFYNALGIPLAALGFMSPILCAAAMGLSDIVVIGNALRLLRR